MALLVEMARLLLFDFKELLEVDYDANAKFLKWKMIKRNKETMAKKQIKSKTIEETLWESANKLRGSVEPSEYKVCSVESHLPEATCCNRRKRTNCSWKNVFVKPNEQCRAWTNIVMARIGNRRHGALSEVERQNALFEERKRSI